ncbi:DUF4296 domain-containing protein [Compostibacter hankyongensis]
MRKQNVKRRLIREMTAILAGAVLLLNGCSGDDDIPKNVFPPDKMGEILIELQMAEGFNESSPDTGWERTNKEHRLKEYYLQVLQLHHTDKEGFLNSYKFYASRPDLMEQLYKLMQDSIQVRLAALDSQQRRQSAASAVLSGGTGLSTRLKTSALLDSSGFLKIRVDNLPKAWLQLRDSMALRLSPAGAEPPVVHSNR